jgi:hypothetical protein
MKIPLAFFHDVNGYVRQLSLPSRPFIFSDHKWSMPIGENNKILQELPLTLRCRLDLILKSELVNRIEIFNYLSPQHATSLVRELDAVVFLPGSFFIVPVLLDSLD